MNYITNDITVDGVAKKQVYKLVGMEDENGNMVNIKVFDGEYTRDEVLTAITEAENVVTQAQLRVTELQDKLTHFPI